MAGVADKFKSIVGFLTSGFENRDEDLWDQMASEMDEYPVSDNLALEPMYSSKQHQTPASNVVSHPGFKGYEVVVSEPRSYEESVSIVKQLKDRKTVILNLHLLDKEQAMRIVDFLCGSTHPLNGNQQKIGDSVFIFTPNNVSLSSESQKSKFIRDALWNQPQ